MSALRNFPTFLIGVVLGLLRAILTEVEVFLLTVFGILLGFLTSPLLALTVTLGVYIVLRVFGGYVGTIARKIDTLAQVIYRGSHEQ